jgi:hypothetical protein
MWKVGNLRGSTSVHLSYTLGYALICGCVAAHSYAACLSQGIVDYLCIGIDSIFCFCVCTSLCCSLAIAIAAAIAVVGLPVVSRRSASLGSGLSRGRAPARHARAIQLT